MKYNVEVVAIDCLMVRLFDLIDEANMPWILAAQTRLSAAFSNGLVDIVPSYTTIMIHFDLALVNPLQAKQVIRSALSDLAPAASTTGRHHPVPVWYDRTVGPELELLAKQINRSVEEVIELHSQQHYHVFALGFAPGFAFMGMVPEVLATARLSTPRKRVMPGSVGIAERQTAVYPAESPGGWNILGRTPTTLFDPAIEGYSLFQPGDTVQFVPIDRAEFLRLGGDATPLEALS
ncbi:5-oxoprolinase subunit PxpB [Pseudomonas sp. 18.1.10]|uniref:5-oxoprolinase subunit PxpB n=1 Tax=Pseudomonas sp. 18.1.10 TaxID=2969302 RepID=UPI002150692D|nr:5-oxoprolinase subunit PxpB [Pseudomonas sp. 18.1.10]MCR4536893.1 5-oxoprolinase subunit PxpB [Pseudomonas sp. 18.1.10]